MDATTTLIVVFCVVFWFICGIIAAAIGSSKSGAMGVIFGLLVGFLFGPIGVLWAFVSPGNTKTCRACQKRVDINATKCPFCQQSFTVTSAPRGVPPPLPPSKPAPPIMKIFIYIANELKVLTRIIKLVRFSILEPSQWSHRLVKRVWTLGNHCHRFYNNLFVRQNYENTSHSSSMDVGSSWPGHLVEATRSHLSEYSRLDKPSVEHCRS